MSFRKKRLSLTLALLVFFMFNYDFNRTMTAYTGVLSTMYFSDNFPRQDSMLDLNYNCNLMIFFSNLEKFYMNFQYRV